VLLVAALLAGCATEPPKTAVTLEQLVAEHNASAGRVEKLWANAAISVTMPSRRGNFNWTFSSGTLLLGKSPEHPLGPYNFVLIGKEAGSDAFRLGSNVEQNVYYLWARFGDDGQIYRGRLNLAGAPGVDIPVDPTQLPAVLNVLEWPSDLTQIPTVTMTLHQGVCKGLLCYKPEYAYVLTYIDRQPLSNRILFKREVLVRWSDTEPRRPYQVNFIDPAGKRVMIAKLADYKSIDLGEDADKSAPPVMMPTDIDITWPEKGSRIHLVLSDMTTTKGLPEGASKLVPPGNLPTTFVDQGLLPVLPATLPASIPTGGAQ
jgi:hypothetical protein